MGEPLLCLGLSRGRLVLGPVRYPLRHRWLRIVLPTPDQKLPKHAVI